MKIIYQINTDVHWENSGKANSMNCNTYNIRRGVMVTEKVKTTRALDEINKHKTSRYISHDITAPFI